MQAGVSDIHDDEKERWERELGSGWPLVHPLYEYFPDDDEGKEVGGEWRCLQFDSRKVKMGEVPGATIHPYGYLRLVMGRRDGSGELVAEYAHRIISWLMVGPEEVKGSEVVMHFCSNPLCVSPAHLMVGSQAENLSCRKRKRQGRLGGAGQHTPGQLKMMRDAYRRHKRFMNAG